MNKTNIIFFGYGLLIGSLMSFGAMIIHDHNKPIKPPASLSEPQTAELWTVSGYCVCEKCCGKWADGITASGKPAVGMIIAAPPEIPFGTKIYIKGWGWGEVQDRGGSIKGKRLDLLFPTHDLALNWGIKEMEIQL